MPPHLPKEGMLIHTITVLTPFYLICTHQHPSPRYNLQMKALKCKTLGAELGHAYTLCCIIGAFYADDHLPTLNACRY